MEAGQSERRGRCEEEVSERAPSGLKATMKQQSEHSLPNLAYRTAFNLVMPSSQSSRSVSRVSACARSFFNEACSSVRTSLAGSRRKDESSLYLMHPKSGQPAPWLFRAPSRSSAPLASTHITSSSSSISSTSVSTSSTSSSCFLIDSSSAVTSSERELSLENALMLRWSSRVTGVSASASSFSSCSSSEGQRAARRTEKGASAPSAS